MKRLIALFLFAVALTTPATAQIALPSPGKAILGVGAGKLCWDHKFLCAAAAVGVGAHVIANSNENAGTKTRGVADTNCAEPSVPIFRAVHRVEYGVIKVSRRYVGAPGGIEGKQFWLSVDDAYWYADRQDPTFTTRTWLTRSMICPETLAMGEPFADIGHQAVHFRPDALEFVNNEAKRSGGIQTQEMSR